MLKLIANNKTLDISNISFNITQNSPISTKTGNFVYSFTIPYSQNNAQIFNFPTRLQRLEKHSIELPGQILFNDKIIQTGIWHAKTSTEKTISLEMIFSLSIFNDSILDVMLPDLFDEEIFEPDIITHLETQVTKTWPEVNHNFPVIYNPEFYGDPDDEDNPNPQFEGFLNNYKDNFISNGSLNRNTISPQLYLPYVIKHIFQQKEYSIVTNIFEDEMLKKAMIYNNYALDKLLATNFYGEFSQSTSYPDFIIKWNKNINDPGKNYDNNGNFKALIAGNYKITLPFTYIKDELCDFYLKIYYNDPVTPIYTKIIIKKPGENNSYSGQIDLLHTISEEDAGNNFFCAAYFYYTASNEKKILNINASIEIINTTQPFANILENTFNYRNLVPNISVKEFLNSFYESFGILPFFDEKTKNVSLIFYKDFLKISNLSNTFKNGLIKNSLKVNSNDYKGITFKFNFNGADNFSNDGEIKDNAIIVNTFFDLPSFIKEGDIYYIKSLNAYYQKLFDNDLDIFILKSIGDLNEPYILEESKITKTINFAPMHMRNPQNSLYEHRNIPSISVQGTSNAYNIKNEFPLRIMFWVGLTTVTHAIHNFDYPLATTTKYDTEGNIVLPINWNTEEIQTYYFSKYIKWLKNRLKIEFQNEINSNSINNINFMQKYLFQYATILLEESYIKVQNKQLGPGKFTGWTI